MSERAFIIQDDIRPLNLLLEGGEWEVKFVCPMPSSVSSGGSTAIKSFMPTCLVILQER